MFVSSDASAEEIVGEVWVAVLTGLDRFEGRSSLRTWIFRIATNSQDARRPRVAVGAAVQRAGRRGRGPAVDEARFADGRVGSPVRPWGLDAAQIALDDEAARGSGRRSTGSPRCSGR